MGTLVILFRFRLVALRHDPSEPSNLKEEEEEGMGKEGRREKKHLIRERKRKKREGGREGERGEVGRGDLRDGFKVLTIFKTLPYCTSDYNKNSNYSTMRRP